MALIDNLIKEGWLRRPRIIEAFRKIRRVDFLPGEMKDLAELNEALPIGYGQTISQPLVVAFMIELLDPQAGDKILDIGSGSGWTSALLAHIVSGGELKSKIRGKVIAIDVIPELVEFGEKNVSKYNFVERGIVEFVCADGSKGYQKEAPFDKILASASAEKLPPAWKEQLKIGGRIVTPIGNSIWLFIKKSPESFEEIEYPGFVFVPLIERTL
jgi:protein-L-isoaspartate(D-aspartate) O-methyltransferase